VAVVLPSKALPGACSCAAEVVSDLENTLPNCLVYPGLSRPQTKVGLPAIHVEGHRGHSHFYLEAPYQYSPVGSSNSSKASVIEFLEFFLAPFYKIFVLGGAHHAGLPVVIAEWTNEV
jgi:hypothetical protein